MIQAMIEHKIHIVSMLNDNIFSIYSPSTLLAVGWTYDCFQKKIQSKAVYARGQYREKYKVWSLAYSKRGCIVNFEEYRSRYSENRFRQKCSLGDGVDLMLSDNIHLGSMVVSDNFLISYYKLIYIILYFL